MRLYLLIVLFPIESVAYSRHAKVRDSFPSWQKDLSFGVRYLPLVSQGASDVQGTLLTFEIRGKYPMLRLGGEMVPILNFVGTSTTLVDDVILT